MVNLDVIKLSWIREYFEIPMSIFIPSFVIYVKQGGGASVFLLSEYHNIIQSRGRGGERKAEQEKSREYRFI